MSNDYKIVVFVPVTHSQVVRDVMGQNGAGQIGDYSGCSFTSKGIGRFLPGTNSNPYIGEAGKSEEVEEERIEMVCSKVDITKVIAEMKKVHPYEEVAYDVYKLENF